MPKNEVTPIGGQNVKFSNFQTILKMVKDKLVDEFDFSMTEEQYAFSPEGKGTGSITFYVSGITVSVQNQCVPVISCLSEIHGSDLKEFYIDDQSVLFSFFEYMDLLIDLDNVSRSFFYGCTPLTYDNAKKIVDLNNLVKEYNPDGQPKEYNGGWYNVLIKDGDPIEIDARERVFMKTDTPMLFDVKMGLEDISNLYNVNLDGCHIVCMRLLPINN